ncbi:uncharacterized protein [Rutidosis leptorrhynchoides]|uniref:uncharacterized protein n=1 Tax=Rutidosis leptorrhynchoides TaxID=125765 RepID=UPI003A99127C
MRVSFLHASTDFQKRTCLWQKLRAIHHINSLPWICMGDFNKVLNLWEKDGRRGMDHYQMVAFREMPNDCALMDIESKGCAHTWSNNRVGENLVRERLDRVLCNVEWRVEFPNAEAVALPALGSDHSPLILTLYLNILRRKKEFRFEAYWLEDPECRDIVKGAWNDHHNTLGDVYDKQIAPQ